MKLAWIYAEKKRRQFCQTMDINVTQKRSTKEYLEQRTGETNVNNWFRVKTEKDGCGCVKQQDENECMVLGFRCVASSKA